jgi:hypothetical protein
VADLDPTIYRVHLADPDGGTTVHELPTSEFQATERGIAMYGAMVVPWRRVLRYTRDLEVQLNDGGLPTRGEVRIWLDDGSSAGKTYLVRGDRFDTGPWTAEFITEVLVDVERGVVQLMKIHVPWDRVLEYERMSHAVEVPERVD